MALALGIGVGEGIGMGRATNTTAGNTEPAWAIGAEAELVLFGNLGPILDTPGFPTRVPGKA